MFCLIKKEFIGFIGFLAVLVLLGVFCIGTSLLSFLYLKIRITRRQSTIMSTSKLQYMLFKALVVQVTIGFIGLLFPLMIFALLLFFDGGNTGEISSILVTIMSFHGLLDYVTMLYFISPYKRAIRGWLRISDASSISEFLFDFGEILIKF